MFIPRLVAPAAFLLVVPVATPPATCAQGAAPISLTALDLAYRQDFDSLATAGTSRVLPAGWALVESGDNADNSYTAGTGSMAVDDIYSFGAEGSSDRALGVQGGSPESRVGALFTNRTGATITSLEIGYSGEQWRLGAPGRLDRLEFEYSPGTTSLAEGDWSDARALDFRAPTSGPTVGMLDGNAAVNRSTLIAIVTGLIIPPGTTFGIRWADYDPSGPDDGLAVDDFTLTPRGGDDVSGYYRGELRDFKTDDLQVGLSLCVDGTVVRGSYFYLRSGGDIRLRGTRAPDGGVELEETTPPGVVTGRWSGRPAPSVGGGWSDRIAPTLTGTWTAPKGDRHRFTLVKAGAIPADSGASGQAGATERPCSEVGYRMVRLSPRKQDYYPRLVRFRDPDVMATVNAVLEYQGRSFHEGLESDLRSSCEKDGDQQVDIGVEYASRDVLSIRVVGEWMCYGPGGVPGQRDDSVTYDLRTGEPITDLTTLFKPGLPWQELFGVLFAYQIAAAASPRGDECLRQYTPQKLGPLGVAFHLTSSGLVVGPSSYGLSSEVGHCEQMTVVPYALLRGLAPPDGVLARVAGPSSPAGPARYLIRNWDDEGVQIVYQPPQPRR